MRPLVELPFAERRRIKAVLCDIDDTLTTAGRLPSASLGALEALAEAGLIVIPVTGRPAGWCDHIARMWPVHAVVGENGAFYFCYDHQQRKMHSTFAKTARERAADRTRLGQLRELILREIPGAGVASDQDYRIADLAIDYCEDVPPLPKAEIERIVALFEQAGAKAKVSSIHVNGWFGDYDKLSMTERCLRELFELDLTSDNDKILFIGDSPNDAPMFRAFKHSVGVANVRNFELNDFPAWVTRQKSSAGFIEFAEHLLRTHMK